MERFTVERISSMGKTATHHSHSLDAKNTLALEFKREVEALHNLRIAKEFYIFVGLPSGVRMTLAPQNIDNTSILEVGGIIRNSYILPLRRDTSSKYTIQIKHTTNNDLNIVFTLSITEE
jgi:hypothetical protein